MTKTVRCIACGSDFTDTEVEECSSCPNCDCSSIPAYIPSEQPITLMLKQWLSLSSMSDAWVASMGGAISEDCCKMISLRRLSIIATAAEAQLAGFSRDTSNESLDEQEVSCSLHES